MNTAIPFMLNPNQALNDLAAYARKSLQGKLMVEASLVAAAPGRVNLIGEHIDYCDGFVLPLAIERYVVFAAVQTTATLLASQPKDKKPLKLTSPLSRRSPT